LKGIILQINIKIIRCFEENDKEKTGEYMTSVFINDKKVIVGDEYHDKINYKIEGMRILIENLGLNMDTSIVKKDIFLPEEEMWEWQGEERLKD